MASNAMGAPEYGEREARREATPGRAADAGVATTHYTVQWAPIWGGLIGTLAIFLLLEFLAIGIGLVTTSNGGGLSAWITGLVALIAFFVGGWIAETTAAARGTRSGVMTGLIVWALDIVLIGVMSVFGMSAFFGVVGGVLGGFLAAGQTASLAGIHASAIANASSSAGWGAFLMLLLTAIVAAIGGWVGDMTGPLHWMHNPQ